MNFGDCVTADHIIIGEKQESQRHDTVAVIVQDKATYWLAGYPKASKTTDDTVAALQNFVGPHDKVKLFYSEGSGELKGAAKVTKWLFLSRAWYSVTLTAFVMSLSNWSPPISKKLTKAA